ncbi:uncharacterized protein LOC128250642 [Octopus bimaculoides]|uniref:uncharacterized protein LOC128250642 n=1 Tax=Octopus bimaculoides TaxID=37653 RepID=UPI0022E2CC73|nr:uncharacterized protein LOC128250642 [Octopus bimaculoides]
MEISYREIFPQKQCDIPFCKKTQCDLREIWLLFLTNLSDCVEATIASDVVCCFLLFVDIAVDVDVVVVVGGGVAITLGIIITQNIFLSSTGYGGYNEAMVHYEKALDVLKSRNIQYRQALLYNSMALNAYMRGNHVEALNFAEKGYNMTITDASPQMVKDAKIKCASTLAYQLSFVGNNCIMSLKLHADGVVVVVVVA